MRHCVTFHEQAALIHRFIILKVIHLEYVINLEIDVGLIIFEFCLVLVLLVTRIDTVLLLLELEPLVLVLVVLLVTEQSLHLLFKLIDLVLLLHTL